MDAPDLSCYSKQTRVRYEVWARSERWDWEKPFPGTDSKSRAKKWADNFRTAGYEVLVFEVTIIEERKQVEL